MDDYLENLNATNVAHDNQKQTHWAYIAGIMDADGCFLISKHKRKTPENRKWVVLFERTPTYIPSVKISMIEKEAIDFITNEVGFGKYNLNGARKGRPNSKPIYNWYMRGKHVIPFLENVIPFLKVKKERAQFILQFARNFKNTKDGYHGVPDDELDYRETSYIHMRELNGNKVAATTKFHRHVSVSDSLAS